MALAVATTLVTRPDLCILSCTWADGDTTGTLTNGTDFTFRNNAAVLVAPVAVMAQLNTQVAASGMAAAVVVGANVVCSKVAGAGTGAGGAFTIYLYGPRSKFVS
jgi:hypothetical protein